MMNAKEAKQFSQKSADYSIAWAIQMACGEGRVGIAVPVNISKNKIKELTELGYFVTDDTERCVGVKIHWSHIE